MVRTHAHGADLHAGTNQEFRSSLKDVQIHRRKEADPFFYAATLSEVGMYERLKDLSEAELDELLDHLTVRLLTNNLNDRAGLIGALMQDLAVNVRKHWTPDADWLSGYRKAQLANLIGKLQGPAHGSAALKRRKSELVADAAGLFKKAAEGPDSIGSEEMADQVCGWLPEERGAADPHVGGDEHPEDFPEEIEQGAASPN